MTVNKIQKRTLSDECAIYDFTVAQSKKGKLHIDLINELYTLAISEDLYNYKINDNGIVLQDSYFALRSYALMKQKYPDTLAKELKLIKTENNYMNFCNKYKKIINHMPEFKILNKDYIICSHAFINTITFSEDERVQIDFTVDKKILIQRFRQRENITEDTFDKNIELYYKSYEKILKDNVSNTLDTTDKDIIKKINYLI